MEKVSSGNAIYYISWCSQRRGYPLFWPDPLVFRPDPYHSYKHFWVGGDWPDRLLEALWAYRTSFCIATGPLLLSRWHGRHSSQWTRRFLPCAFCSTTIWLIIRSERLCSRNLTSSIRSMGEKKGYERQSTHKSINVNSAALWTDPTNKRH